MKKALFAVPLIIAGAVTQTVEAKEWQATAGAQSADRGSQALAFLPNELWIHAGDTIRWTFPTYEIHTVTFLKSGQTRPLPFANGFEVGCPGTTPDGSSVDGSACVNSGTHCADAVANCSVSGQSYTVTFPAAGNFKLVCLIHVDMTGLIHVLNASEPLPHDDESYNTQANNQRAVLLTYAARLGRTAAPEDEDAVNSAKVRAGIAATMATGGGSQALSFSRFLQNTVVVRVGDTVEWTNPEPSRNHTVTFGTEPADAAPPSSNLTMDSDGARHAIITSATDSVNSGFLAPAPQDRPMLPQSPPGVTRFRVTFKAPGTFNYICALHDEIGMKGTVIVNP
jgi:plastocyanin